MTITTNLITAKLWLETGRDPNDRRCKVCTWRITTADPHHWFGAASRTISDAMNDAGKIAENENLTIKTVNIKHLKGLV